MKIMIKCLICGRSFAPADATDNGPSHECSGGYRNRDFAWKKIEVPTSEDKIIGDFDEIMAILINEAEKSGPPVYPNAFYNPDGDMLEVRLSSKARFGRRIDNLLTVYYADDNENEIVGYDIKSLSRLMPRLERDLPVLNIPRMD
jgi:hypothetical protein